jgi:hypothetical protein
MRILKLKNENDYHGLWILPTIGFSWVEKDYSFWVGWLFWQWCIELKTNMGVKTYLDKNGKEIVH